KKETPSFERFSSLFVASRRKCIPFVGKTSSLRHGLPLSNPGSPFLIHRVVGWNKLAYSTGGYSGRNTSLLQDRSGPGVDVLRRLWGRSRENVDGRAGASGGGAGP